jgi:hypothetical protein
MHMLSTGFHQRKCTAALHVTALSLFHPSFHTLSSLSFPSFPDGNSPVVLGFVEGTWPVILPVFKQFFKSRARTNFV